MSQHVQKIFEPGLALHRVTLFILCLEGHPLVITSWGSSFPPACSSLMNSCAITFFHFSIECRGDECCWRPCLRSLRDTSLALIISSWLLFYTLKRRCIERSCSEQMPSHSSSPGYYARYWSTWDTDACPIGVPIDSTQLMCFDLNPQTGVINKIYKPISPYTRVAFS